MQNIFRIILFFFLSGIVCAYSQTRKEVGIVIKEEKGIAELINDSNGNLEGYRIQVFSGNSSTREEALEIKNYIEQTLGVKAYVKFKAPTFRVRVGNFKEKIEAVKLKYKLKKYYPQCYIVHVKEINLEDKLSVDIK